MGATKVLLRQAIITALALASPVPSLGKDGGMGIHQVFAGRFHSIEAIKKWSDSAFIGGHREWEFSRGDKSVVVVVGMPSSGLPTSQVLIFLRKREGGFGLVLIREKMVGQVTVKEEADNLVFVARDPILIVPWAGIVMGSEQWQ